MDDVRLDCQILVNELGRVVLIGQDTAHLCSGKKYVVRLFLIEESPRRSLISKIKFGVRAQYQIAATFPLELSYDRRACQTTMAGNIDFGSLIHFSEPLAVGKV